MTKPGRGKQYNNDATNKIKSPDTLKSIILPINACPLRSFQSNLNNWEE